MIVVFEKTKYHSMALEYTFDQSKLAFCRRMKEKYGWQKFTFFEKKWRFNDSYILFDITEAYPETLSEPVKQILSGLKIEKAEIVKTKEVVSSLKTATTSSLEIKNIKGELYPYQKIGVEFFLANNGRAILADEMGCISEKAMIDYVEVIDSCPISKINTLKFLFDRFKNHPGRIFYGFSLNEKKELRRNRIKDMFYRGVKEVVELTVFDVNDPKAKRKLVLTPDHKLRSTDDKWIEVQKLKEGQEIYGAGDVWSMSCGTTISRKKVEIFRADERPRGYFISYVATPWKIVSVKKVKKVGVYDISMADPDHNFIVEDITVKNSGKSYQSLAYVAHTEKDRVLVVCPAVVKPSWAKEVRKWTNYDIKILDGKSTSGDFESVTPTVFIINYDILKKHIKILCSSRFDSLLVDECHMIKSRSSQRSKALKLLASHISSTIFISGTPFLNRPEELFTTLNMLDSKTWSNYYEFTTKYCDGKKTQWGWEAKGATNIEELKERISRYFLRRKKIDILPDLPEKIHIDFPVEFSKEARVEYKFAEDEFKRYLLEMKNKSPRELKAMNYATEKLIQLGALRAITTRGKIDAARELIKNVIAGGEKVLVFSSYNEPLDILSAEFGDKAVLITGRTSQEDRGSNVEKFQNDPDCMIFFGGIKSSGVGITLTAATNVIFIDYSWTPADHSQGEDRIHRPGNEASSVNIYQMFVHDTIDSKMTEILKRKQNLFDSIIDGVAESETVVKNYSLMNDLIKRFM